MRPIIIRPAIGAAALAAALCACSSSAPSPTAPAPAAHSAGPAAARSPKPKAPPAGCALKTTFDYIIRDSDPGASVMAQEVGNADLALCEPTLKAFAAEAGQSPGECTTIALASDNPGYDVNAVPAAPLKDVIAEAGPGCP